MSIQGRALHFVFKVADRTATSHFYRNILGMQVLRHEEFTEGCEAACNGPYDNRWSKTMVGYGPESSHFVVELTYNYGVDNYELGNDFLGITIRSKEAIARAKKLNYPIEEHGAAYLLEAPGGYKYYIINEPQPTAADPVEKVTLACSNLENTVDYWTRILDMKIINQTNNSAVLSYGQDQASLEFKDIKSTVNHAKAYGRIAFACPKEQQPNIQQKVENERGTVLTPLVSLDTPGKATVRVVILADPDKHEICFVDEEGFSELSQVDPQAETLLDKYIKNDKSREIPKTSSEDSCVSQEV